MRLDRFERVAGAHLLAADHERKLELLRLELGEPDAQLLPLRRAGGIAPDRLVVRLGNAEDSVGAHGHDSRMSVVAVTHVAYEVDDWRCVYHADGWGVGELWLDEADRVVWHELPRPAQTAPRGTHRAV